jgi:hypothetical protein
VADDRNPHDYSFVVLDRKVTLEQESTAGVSRQPEDPPRDTT